MGVLYKNGKTLTAIEVDNKPIDIRPLDVKKVSHNKDGTITLFVARE
jgi:hypothetical protein